MIWRLGYFEMSKISYCTDFVFIFLFIQYIFNDDDYDCGSCSMCSMNKGSQKLFGSDRSRNPPNNVSISANPSICRSAGAGSESRPISGETVPSTRCLFAAPASLVGASCPVSKVFGITRASCVRDGCPCIWCSAFWPSLAIASAEYQYRLICSNSEQQASRLAFARSRCVMSLLERSWRYETPIERVMEYGTIGKGGRLSAHSDATIEWMRTAARP